MRDIGRFALPLIVTATFTADRGWTAPTLALLIAGGAAAWVGDRRLIRKDT